MVDSGARSYYETPIVYRAIFQGQEEKKRRELGEEGKLQREFFLESEDHTCWHHWALFLGWITRSSNLQGLGNLPLCSGCKTADLVDRRPHSAAPGVLASL